MRDLATSRLFDCRDYLADADPNASAQIKRSWGLPLLLQQIESSDMSSGKVGYMNVVAHTGAVWGRVVVAKD